MGMFAEWMMSAYRKLLQTGTWQVNEGGAGQKWIRRTRLRSHGSITTKVMVLYWVGRNGKESSFFFPGRGNPKEEQLQNVIDIYIFPSNINKKITAFSEKYKLKKPQSWKYSLH